MTPDEANAANLDAQGLYQQSVLEQSLEFDKQLVWLAGGAIALITALVSALRPAFSASQRVLLVVGLVTLLSSLALTLASLQVSIADSGAVLAGASDANRRFREKRMRAFNWTSLTLFVAGVAVFVSFAVSISEGGTVSGPKQQPGNGMPASVPTRQEASQAPAPPVESPSQAPKPAPEPKK